MPRRQVPVGRLGLSAFGLDHVVVIGITAEIGCRKIRIVPFLCLIDAPILAIEIHVEPSTARVGLAKVALGDAGQFVFDIVGS